MIEPPDGYQLPISYFTHCVTDGSATYFCLNGKTFPTEIEAIENHNFIAKSVGKKIEKESVCE